MGTKILRNHNQYGYSFPSEGIPKSDLSESVQASLDKADTALQEHQSLEGYVTTTDSRLSDARPASDVYAWAKAETKPQYTAAEVNALPDTTTVVASISTSTDSTANTITTVLKDTSGTSISTSTADLPQETEITAQNISDWYAEI